MESMRMKGHEKLKQGCATHFEMPLHYPRYTASDYQSMPEWRIDCLLAQYGLPVSGDIAHKRSFAMGAFLWSSTFN